MPEYLEKEGLKKSITSLLSIEKVAPNIIQLVIDIIDGEMLADVQPIDAKEILKHLDSLMICVGNAYNTSHYLLESDMEFIEKQEKIIRELLNEKI